MKYLLIAALLLAFGAFGKLIGSGVGPAEDERRAKWQGGRKGAGGEDAGLEVKMGGYEITDDEPDDRRAAPRSDAEARLTELRSLYDRGLITEEEYEAKRRDILSDL